MNEWILLTLIGLIHSGAWLLTELWVNRHHTNVTYKELTAVGICQIGALLIFVVFFKMPHMTAIAFVLVTQALADHLIFKNNEAFSILLTSIFFVMIVNLNMIVLAVTEYFFKPSLNEDKTTLLVSLVVYALVLVVMKITGKWVSDLHQSLIRRSKLSITLIALNGFIPMLIYGLFFTFREAINPFYIFPTPVYRLWVVIELLFFVMLLFYFFISFLLTYFFIKYKNRSEYDLMTQTLNKATGLHNLEKLLKKALLNKKPISVSFIDIDALKAINDQYGHEMGDLAILKAVEVIKSNIRQTDALFRYGGDEFVLGIYDCEKAQIEAIFQRVLGELEAFVRRENYPFEICFSYGIKVHDGIANLDAEALIHLADQEMYKKKFMNKVVSYHY